MSYNTRDHLSRCLVSLQGEPLQGVIVVDNASCDGSAALVAERFPAVRLIANAANPGYAAAANQALRAARSPYLLLLNADTEVRPGAVASLLDCLKAHSAAAIAAPRLEDPAGVRQSSCFQFPGTAGWLLENAPLSIWTRHVPFARQRSVSFRHGSASRQVPWVLGAAMLLRCDAVREVGGLDETYFLFYEEVDLCRKLAQRGWVTYYVPNAVVMHVGAASTSQQSTAMLRQRIQSTVEYYERHCTAAQRWLWTGLLRTKWAALLIRDVARLLVTGDPMTRRRLRDQQTVYRTALFTRSTAGAVPQRPAARR